MDGYLTVLALSELRQHEALRPLQSMDPLDDSERAQYRANHFWASSARIATVMAKATIMQLTGAPSLPVAATVSRQHIAHNNPGVSDLRNMGQSSGSSTFLSIEWLLYNPTHLLQPPNI
jgi:hypothetical protein